MSSACRTHPSPDLLKEFPTRLLILRQTEKNISLGMDEMIKSMVMAEEKIKLWSVNDNAANMRVAIRESQYMEELYCGIHKISLAVTDTFKSVQGMMRLESPKKGEEAC